MFQRVVYHFELTSRNQCIRFNSKQEFLDDVAGEHLWFRIPSDCWLLVAHNAAFEISWFLTYQRQHYIQKVKPVVDEVFEEEMRKYKALLAQVGPQGSTSIKKPERIQTYIAPGS